MISGTTELIGLLGQPVSHSLSPVMHNAALKAMALDWRYMAFPCDAENLKAVLDGLQAMGCRGLSVTIPHKQQVVGLCQELSPLARRLGAVNTLTPLKEGGWHGHNTDMEGFLAPLQTQLEQWLGAEAVVLGCGGSARAVVAGLQQLPLTAIPCRRETPRCAGYLSERPAGRPVQRQRAADRHEPRSGTAQQGLETIKACGEHHSCRNAGARG